MPIPVDLSKLSDVVKNDVFKKTAYDKLVTRVNSIDTSGVVLKTKYDTDKSELQNKIPDTNALVKKTDYDAKITDVEGKIPDVSYLAAKIALATVENRTPSVGSLVKKTDYDTKVKEVEDKLNSNNHDKYITTPEFNILAADVFNARLAQANLMVKTNFNNTVSSLNSKIVENKTKNESVENQLEKLKTFDLGYFVGKSYFEEDGAQNYLIFQSIHRYFKITNAKYISSWKSKGLSDETITPYATSDNSLTPLIYQSKSKI